MTRLRVDSMIPLPAALVGGVMVVLLVAASGEPAQAQERRQIGVFALRPGTGSYGFSQVLADLVNKYSKSVTLHLRTTSGAAEHLRIMTTKPQERTSNIFTAELVTVLWAQKGVEFYKEPYAGTRAISLFSNATLALASYDRNIRTKDDLIGKRIMAYPRFFSAGRIVEALVKDVWKIGDRVTLSHGLPTVVVRALGDRTVDVGQVDVEGMPGGPWHVGEELNQLQILKPGIYFMGFTPEDFKVASKVLGVDVPSDVVSPGSYGPNQKEPIRGIVSALFWAADASMDPGIVYEITRILYERVQELNQAYPSSVLIRDKMAALNMTADFFHPGAATFFKKVGVPIGLK
ncbi:MAG: hypothetical protein HYT78_21355 [Deltaproteobacteria bacterium]|nr:hypothetical protein [Deltaproteobacteria bacterium]